MIVCRVPGRWVEGVGRRDSNNEDMYKWGMSFAVIYKLSQDLRKICLDEISSSSVNTACYHPAPGAEEEGSQATRQFYRFRTANKAARPPCRLDRAMRMLMLNQILLHPMPMAYRGVAHEMDCPT